MVADLLPSIPMNLSSKCAVVALLASALAPVSAQILAYEGFGNGPLADLNGSTAGTGWQSAWTDTGTDATSVGGPGLSYDGLARTPGGAITALATGVWPSSHYTRAFTPAPFGASALYVSFLLRLDAGAGMWGGLTFGQYPYGMSVGAASGMYVYGLMGSNGLGSLTNKPVVIGETTLVVLKIATSPGSGTSWQLYLDPVVGAPEPVYPDAAMSLAQVASLPTSLHLDNGTGFTTDEIRVGLSWASVLPPGPSTWTDVGFAKPGIWGAPQLAGSGPLAPGTSNLLLLTHANALSPALLVTGFVAQNTALLGGILVPEPVLVSFASTDAGGALSASLPVPGFAPVGLPILFQYWIQDSAATFGWSASNGLRGVIQ